MPSGNGARPSWLLALAGILLTLALWAQLLVRTTRSASPTENGQAYYERCTTILADLEDADRAVARLHLDRNST